MQLRKRFQGCPADSVKQPTLDLGVMSLNPMLGTVHLTETYIHIYILKKTIPFIIASKIIKDPGMYLRGSVKTYTLKTTKHS